MLMNNGNIIDTQIKAQRDKDLSQKYAQSCCRVKCDKIYCIPSFSEKYAFLVNKKLMGNAIKSVQTIEHKDVA